MIWFYYFKLILVASLKINTKPDKHMCHDKGRMSINCFGYLRYRHFYLWGESSVCWNYNIYC